MKLSPARRRQSPTIQGPVEIRLAREHPGGVGQWNIDQSNERDDVVCGANDAGGAEKDSRQCDCTFGVD